MLGYTVRRIVLLLPILFSISVLIFGILKMTPGDPAVVLLGDRATEVTLSFTLMASTTRITRSSMLEVIKADYIRTARAKGAGEYSVILVHALSNALVPITTNIGNQLARLFAGAVLTETVFAWPGGGRLAVNAIFRRDEPLVFGCVLVLSVIYVGVNLLVDLSYALLNPQIRYE